MKRMVVIFDCKYKSQVRAYLTANRIQYSMSIDIYTGEVRCSVPYSKGVSFLAELRCDSVPYELV